MEDPKLADVQIERPTGSRDLRLWPGVLLVTLQWLARYAMPLLIPETGYQAVLAGLAGGLLVLVWWVFFSRAPWAERLGAVLLIGLGIVITPSFLHESIATGAMGALFVISAVPLVSLALVLWAVASRSLPAGSRWATLALALLGATGGWGLVRTEGFTGEGDSDFEWRWSKTPEERLLARSPEASAPPPSAGSLAAAAGGAGTASEWPGFRGAGRDGEVPGLRIETDWQSSPPTEIWRRAVGPGWSSFAVGGDRIYTQEQRGEEEVVSCYHAATGEPIWRHGDAARFWESNAGAGPRATPTLSGGRVFALGATGILNVLDAATGALLWARNAAADTATEVPDWGFSGSPLVSGEVVVVAVAGTLAAYDLATGESRWTGPQGGDGYSSPHRAMIDGVEQVLLLGSKGLTSVTPADGAVLWEHPWPGYPIVQPAVTEAGEVLISVRDSSGTRRLAVAREAGGWTVEERWTSIRLKPYFNDFVLHDGHAYGFDGRILACIDLEKGERQWKGGRYGNGQLVLLPEQDLLLVVSELGELALVSATPDGFQELARFPALEGKTWNHPVLAGELLLVRNSEEMAAFRLALADD